jgi:hypothetical protein
MYRFVMLLTVFPIVFAAFGMHNSVAASLEQSSTQYHSATAELDFIPNSDDQDCCAEMDFVKHTPHDHCNVSCAILPSTNRIDGSWTIGKTSEFRTDRVAGDLMDLEKRPPRNLN